MQVQHRFIGGQGPVMVLIHGFLGSAAQWHQVVLFYKNRYKLLLITLPGHGGSDPSATAFSIDDLTQAIHALLVRYHIPHAHVVGHSMGGYVGAAFAKAYPEKTSSLTLINSIAGPDASARKTLRNRAIQLIEKYQDAYVSMAVSNLFTTEEQLVHIKAIHAMKEHANGISLGAIIHALKAMRDRSGVLNELKKSGFPIVFITGKHDTVIAESLIIQEVQTLQAAHFSIAGGHMLLMTHASELIKAINNAGILNS